MLTGCRGRIGKPIRRGEYDDAVGNGGCEHALHHPEDHGKDEVRQHLAELGFVVGEPVRVVNELAGNLILSVKVAELPWTGTWRCESWFENRGGDGGMKTLKEVRIGQSAIIKKIAWRRAR